MKKPLVILIVAIIMILSLPVGAIASPSISPIWQCHDFSQFNELRNMANDAADAELHEFLWQRGYFHDGITNREDALEFVDTVGSALIPVLPGLEGSGYIMEIIMNRAHADQGALSFLFGHDGGHTIMLRSFYGYERREDIWELELWDFDAFDSPTAVKNEVKYYQLDYPGWDNFVIIVDDYILFGMFLSSEQPGLSPEEQLAELQRFSFMRLEDAAMQFGVAATGDSSWLLRVLIAAAGVIVAGAAAAVIVMKRRAHSDDDSTM